VVSIPRNLERNLAHLAPVRQRRISIADDLADKLKNCLNLQKKSKIPSFSLGAGNAHQV